MTGSLQVKNGRFYMVLSTMKDGKQTLKWRSTGLTVKGNKRKAEDMLREYLKVQDAFVSLHSSNDISMPDLISEWLKVKKREIRHNSYASYEETANLHVIPYFADYTALQLTAAHIKQYYNKKSADGLSTESLTRHRTILRGALDYAVETLGLLTVNVADRAKLPKNTQKRTPTYYDAAQIKKLFQEVHGESIEAPVRLAATYGLRRSEALGLRWCDVDFVGKTVRIQHTATRSGNETIYDDTVKEAASYRTMPLTKDIEAYLGALQSRQKALRKLGGKSYHKSDYVCVWEDGRPLDPAYVTSRFRRFLKEKNLPHIRFHDLRHSSASLLVNSGYTLEEVMKWLGHASIRSTERYAHLQANSKNEMAQKVNEMLALE